MSDANTQVLKHQGPYLPKMINDKSCAIHRIVVLFFNLAFNDYESILLFSLKVLRL